MTARWLVLIPVVVWQAVLIGASSIPAARLPSVSWWAHQDKVVHGLAYAIQGLLVMRATVKARGPHWRSVIVAVAIVAIIGGVDELFQSLVPGRVPSVADWCADVIGGGLGAMSFLLWQSYNRLRDRTLV